MKRKICITMVAGLLAFTLAGTATAYSGVAFEHDVALNATSENIYRAEQTAWYYRIVDGKKQMRLWSITEGMWLTDWMDVT